MSEKRVYEVLYVEDLLKQIERLEGALRKIYLWDEAGGGCTECSAGSLAKQALGGDERFAEEMLKGYENERTN